MSKQQEFNTFLIVGLLNYRHFFKYVTLKYINYVFMDFRFKYDANDLEFNTKFLTFIKYYNTKNI